MARKKSSKRGDPGGGLFAEPPERTSVWRSLRNYFFTGIVVATPVTITVWLVYTFVRFADNTVKPLIPRAYNPETYLPFAIPGLGIVFAILMLTMLGALAANILGRSLLSGGERLVARLPLVRNIYNALKQLIETFVAQRRNSFKEVVLVEYPRPGLYALGFITAAARGEVAQALGPDMVGVFVPTTPNPTSGFLLYAPRADLRVLKMSVEEGAKLIISAGLVTPGDSTDPLQPAVATAEDGLETPESPGA